MKVAINTCEKDLPTPQQLRQVESEISYTLLGRLSGFRISIHDDGLILEGHCYTFYGKQLALSAVMKALPTPIRANNIQVI